MLKKKKKRRYLKSSNAFMNELVGSNHLPIGKNVNMEMLHLPKMRHLQLRKGEK